MEATTETKEPAREDDRLQAALLGLLIALHPSQLTFQELLREVCGGAVGFEERDGVARAVRDLAAAGLAHRNGDVVIPSRAALRFEQLLER